MLKKIAAAASVSALVVALPMQAVNGEDLVTSRQLWKMPQKEAASQSWKDLTSILSPAGIYPRGREGVLFRDGVQGTNFFTRTYGTGYPGICARDVLTLSYAHVHDDMNAPDRAAEPVRPYHVSVSQEFAFVQQPTWKMLNQSERGGSQFRAECHDLGSRVTWFSVFSDDPRKAANGWLLFQNAATEVQAGTLNPSKCETENANATCAKLLDSLTNYHALYSVWVDFSGSLHHYHLIVGDYSVTIDAKEDDRVTAISVEEKPIAVD